MSATQSEEWRPAPGLVGHYDVSSEGRVRSRTRRGRVGRVLRPHSAKGYLRVNMTADGVRHQVSVHTLVLLAFHGPRPDDGTASHVNGVRTDNRASNLTWENWSANHQRKREHGTSGAGSQNYQTHLTEDRVRSIRAQRAAGARVDVLARENGVTGPTISKICLRQSWTHI